MSNMAGMASMASDESPARSRRRVCNLTPSQIQKKRAIDRTNQQHWRQKKRLYISELEAEVARLKASLDESHAKLKEYETAELAVENAPAVSGPAGAQVGIYQPSPLSVQGPSALPGFHSGPVVSAVSALPPHLPAPDLPLASVALGPGSASPVSTDGGFILDATATITSTALLPPITAGSSAASSDVGWPLAMGMPSISPRARSAALSLHQAQTQAQAQSEAEAEAQTQARTDGSLPLGIFDPTHSLQLFDHGLGEVDEVFDAQPEYASPVVESSSTSRRYVTQEQQEQQHQQHQQQLYRNYHRHHAVYGTAPSPLLTSLTYLPYYLASRYSTPGASVPDWMALPLNLPVSTELDKLVLITSQALVQRYSTHEFSNPVFPSIEGLMSRLRTDNTPQAAAAAAARLQGGGDSSEADTAAANRPVVAAVASHVVWKSPLKRLTGRLAFLYKLAHFVRWCLCPTKENYDAIPDFLKPTPLQRRVPHPVWVDLIIWPDVRDSLIRGGDYSAFELYRFVLGNTITVNWPYTEASTFAECEGGKRLTLNPIFEAHIRNIDNYSVGLTAAAAFPVLSRYVRVTT